MKVSEEINSNLDINLPATSQSRTSVKPLQTEVQNNPAVEEPIQRVPLDVLHEIVLYCLPVHPTVELASPVISSLSRVSSTWRAAVLSSPRLWSRLFLTVQDDDDLDLCAKMVTRWFQHAQSVPLSFFLNIDIEPLDEDIPRIHSFLVELSSVMLRVWHFGLHARLTTELMSSFVNLEWKLPRMKKLDLFSHFDQDRTVPFNLPLFQATPNLVQVAIQNGITAAPDIHHVLPWSQLTNVNVAYSISVSRWVEIMTLCPHLCAFEVFFVQDYAHPSVDYSPKGTHHSLEHLYVETKGGPPFLKLLCIYGLPSLRVLEIMYQSEPVLDFPPPQGISALANLRAFSFDRTPRPKFSREHFNYMVEILREMVNLEELELQRPSQDFLPLYEAISLKRTETAILPRLRILKLWISSDCEVENEEELQPIFEMVSSRCKEDAIPVGYKVLQEFSVGVADEDTHERITEIFRPWVERLPPQLRVNIDLRRHYRYNQPDGWTFPISD